MRRASAFSASAVALIFAWEYSAMADDLKKYAGKNWGDLPGALRTKIVQDLKARYGDDYAQMIKLYFEQIADTKK